AAAAAAAYYLAVPRRSHEPETTTSTAYVDAPPCAGCHSALFQSYRKTGMARALYPPAPQKNLPDSAGKPYYHRASETYYAMARRDGRYYQRRWRIGYDGKESVGEWPADYVMGSGNHVRTYLHRTERGALVELPLAWYAERGGYWA